MSADNWATCPRCAINREREIAADEKRLTESYGAVDADEFLDMRSELDAKRARELPMTLREDYEFYGAEEGEVHADYRAGCNVCGLKVRFEHVHAFAIEVAE